MHVLEQSTSTSKLYLVTFHHWHMIMVELTYSLAFDYVTDWLANYPKDSLTGWWLIWWMVYWLLGLRCIQHIKQEVVSSHRTFISTYSVFTCFCSFVCPSWKLWSIYLSVHLLSGYCCHASAHLSSHIFICPALYVDFFLFIFICMLWCSVWNITECTAVYHTLTFLDSYIKRRMILINTYILTSHSDLIWNL